MGQIVAFLSCTSPESHTWLCSPSICILVFDLLVHWIESRASLNEPNIQYPVFRGLRKLHKNMPGCKELLEGRILGKAKG